MRIPLLLLVPALASAVSRGLAAQAVERPDTPRRGAIRVTFDPRTMTWEHVYTSGGQRSLGADLTGDSVGVAIPSVATLQQDVRSVVGIAGYVASLGRGLLAVRAERRIMPVTVEYGITSRLSLGVTVPIVRVRMREHFRLDTAGSNLGALPLLVTPADSARYGSFFGNFDTALLELGDSIAAGAYGCPTSSQCVRAQGLLAEGQALRGALGQGVYGTPSAPALFLPLRSSDAGQGIDSSVAGIQRALTDTFNVTSFSQDTFLLPTTPASEATVTGLLEDPQTGLGLAPFTDTPRRLRFFPGDVELAAKYRVLVRPSYAASATLLVRLPTGHQDSPNDPFDLSTGDHQTDIEGRVTQELTLWNRLWLNLSLRAARQRAGERERRVGPVDQLFLAPAMLARLRWDPGDYAAVDFAPMFRFSRTFAAGMTVGYYTQQRDRYTFLTAQDSMALVTRLGGPVSAGVLDARTAERRTRLGIAVTYVGPMQEGGFSVERTVSGAGAPVPVATVFRIVLRQTLQLF